MTTYRRLCCNDLLRIGPLNLQFTAITYVMSFYMKSLGIWPGNCHVADTAGGHIAGYILGSVKGEGEDTEGLLSTISVRSMDMIDVAKRLNKLLEACCDKIYRVYSMKFFITLNETDRYLADELGYIEYEKHPDVFELVKPLPLLIELTEERIRRRAGLIM